MRVVWVLAALFVTSLAGCSEGGSGDDEPVTSLDDELVVTSETGAIRGIIVDATITPVAGVTVSIGGTELSTETNENGEFGFGDLEPATYFLTASKLGWMEVQQSVQVEAGVERPPLVKIQMDVEPSTQPFHQALQFDGIIGCSVRAVVRGYSNLCGAATDERPRVDYELESSPDWVVSEATWDSTQALGESLSFNIRRDDTNTDTVDIEGPSPLSLTVNRTTSEGAGFGIDSALRIVMFTAHVEATEPPACFPVDPPEARQCPWGVGAQLDQQFTVFTHMFYNYVPPEGWRFLDDPSVPGAPA